MVALMEMDIDSNSLWREFILSELEGYDDGRDEGSLLSKIFNILLDNMNDSNPLLSDIVGELLDMRHDDSYRGKAISVNTTSQKLAWNCLQGVRSRGNWSEEEERIINCVMGCFIADLADDRIKQSSRLRDELANLFMNET